MNTIRVRFKDIKVGQSFVREADGIEYHKVIPQQDGMGIINAQSVKYRTVVQVQPDARVLIKVSDDKVR